MNGRMKGFFAVFIVRGTEAGPDGPVEKTKRLAVWVEGSLSAELVAGPVTRAELAEVDALIHVVTAETVSALADDFEVSL